MDGQLLELEYIKREAVGKTDKKYIASDQVGIISNPITFTLFSSRGVIQVSNFFVGRTENARSFINQLRPPFSVRKIEAIRTTNYNDNNIEDFKSLSTPDVGDALTFCQLSGI